MKAKINAFTLVEMLVVIAIIGLLAVLLVPAAVAVKDRAGEAACLSNMRQLSVGIELYRQDNERQIPLSLQSTIAANTDAWCDWVADLRANYLTSDKVFSCPGDKQADRRSTISGKTFRVSYGINQMLADRGFPSSPYPPLPPRLETVPRDRASVMPLLADASIPVITGWARARVPNAGWNSPAGGYSPPAIPDKMWRRHPGGSTVLFVDGHVAMVTQDTAANDFSKFRYSPHEGDNW